MTEQSKELAQVSPQMAVSPWGSYQDINSMNKRLAMMTLPGGKRLQPEERMALAQLAVAHELDPFNGEIWLIPGSGPMIGIKGLRKKARQQLNHGKDGNFWTNFVELKPEDKARLKVPADALAFECRLFDTETIRTYLDTIKQLKEVGMPWEVIQSIVGAQPYTSGYGFFKAGEQSRMPAVQCATKRAEADAIRRRFDVPFGLAEGNEAAEEYYEGEWQTAVAAEKATAPSKAQQAADNAALFGGDDFDKPAQPAPAAEEAPWEEAELAVPQDAGEPAKPVRGTMEDFEQLFAQAKELGLKPASVPVGIKPEALTRICESLRAKINAALDQEAAK